jgi:putative ABC transport system substrate-binding protein
MAYGPNNSDMSKHAAVFVDKILKGAKPIDLPVEEPTTFQFFVNLKTSKPQRCWASMYQHPFCCVLTK